MKGHHLYLLEEFDKKLRVFFTHVRMAGGTINYYDFQCFNEAY